MFNVNKSKVGKEKKNSKLRPSISKKSKFEARPTFEARQTLEQKPLSQLHSNFGARIEARPYNGTRLGFIFIICLSNHVHTS